MRARLLTVILSTLPLTPAENQGGDRTKFVEKARIEIPALQATTMPPVWTAHALLLAEHPRSSAPVFRAFSRAGDRIAEFTLAIPDAALINVFSHRFALGFDGSLGVGGSAYASDSTGGAFVARISAHGRQRTLTRLTPLAVPDAVTVAADGSIWVASPGPVEREDPREDYPVILRVDSSGAPPATVLRRSDLKAPSRLVAPCFLVASPDRIGWYSKGARTYLEFSLDGRLLDRFQGVDDSAGHDIYGVALCADGSVYVGVQVRVGSGATVGWGIYNLDRLHRAWSFTPMPGRGILVGCDGSQLVAVTGPTTLSWFDRAGN